MNKNKFRSYLDFYNGLGIKCLVKVGDKNDYDIWFINQCSGNRDFIIQFKYKQESRTDCEVTIEEVKKNQLNILYAHYPIEDKNPKYIDAQLDKVVQNIIQIIHDAYQASL